MTKIVTEKNLELQVSLPDRNSGDEPLMLVAKLTNKSKQPVHLTRHGNGISDLGIEVLNSKDEKPEATKLGRDVMQARGPIRNSVGFRVLHPGGSNEWSVDIRSLYKFAPDSYSLSVTLEMDGMTQPFTIGMSDIRFAVE